MLFWDPILKATPLLYSFPSQVAQIHTFLLLNLNSLRHKIRLAKNGKGVSEWWLWPGGGNTWMGDVRS